MCQITHGQAGYWKPGEDETVNPWIMYMYRYIRKCVRFKWSHTHWRITIQSLPGILATSCTESGNSAGEAVLGFVLVVPGQLRPVSGTPEGTQAPPWFQLSGITINYRLRQLWRWPATHVYMQRRGVGPPLADSYSVLRPVPGAGEGPKALQDPDGWERGGELQLKPHAGQVPPVAAEPPCMGAAPREKYKLDLPRSLRWSPGSSVTGTYKSLYSIVFNPCVIWRENPQKRCLVKKCAKWNE